MRIKSLELLRLKSYDHALIEFSKNINLLVGANNSGKSTIIKSLMNLQYGTFNRQDIRSQELNARIHTKLTEIGEKDNLSFLNSKKMNDLQKAASLDTLWTLGISPANTVGEEYLYLDPKHLSKKGSSLSSLKVISGRDAFLKDFPRFSDSENSNNFIFPFLSKRKTEYYDSNINLEASFKIQEGMRNLAGRIQRIESSSNPRSKKFVSLCEEILGFRVGVIPIDQHNTNGIEPGMYVNSTDAIPIRLMGDGVVNILGFIVTLLTEDGKLYLIEELENDIHPKALKQLLGLIKEKAEKNQFVISTHSNIVLKYLGVMRDSKIFFIENIADMEKVTIPTSRIKEIDNKPEKRLEILEKLGYDFQDFELHESYLLLEESSAEKIIRDFLIPFIVPDLYNRIKTIGAKGVEDLEARVVDFYRLFVFLHSDPVYYKKAWVVADGDEAGNKCINNLKTKFPSWPESHFITFKRSNFEEYYPSRFKAKSAAALKLQGDKKRVAKKALLDEVIVWALQNRELAIQEFSESAEEVIHLLNSIKIQLKVSGRAK